VWSEGYSRDDGVCKPTRLIGDTMHRILFCRAVLTDTVVDGRPVKGRAVMRSVEHLMDSDIIVDVSEDFVDMSSPGARGLKWPDLPKPPEKLSVVQFVANDMLQTIEYVVQSPREIYAMILLAQSEGMKISGS